MSSSTIPKEIFERAAFVSSHDPDVDQNNLVYIESDSEGSEKSREKFNYGIHLQETALQEVVCSAAMDVNDEVIDITDNPIHVTVKREEEFIIEDEPIQIDNDLSEENSSDSWISAMELENNLTGFTSAAVKKEPESEDAKLQAGITRIDPPVGMCTPPLIPEYLNVDEDKDEEQFVLICNSAPEAAKKTDDDNAAMDTSLLDHQYSQQETASGEFCFELVQNLLKESGNEANPTAVPLLTKFTDLVECFVDKHEQANSQMSLLLTSMKKTLNGLTIPPAEDDKPPALEQASEDLNGTTSTLCSMTQEDIQKEASELFSEEVINIPETQSEEETGNETKEEIIEKKEPENDNALQENGNITKLKTEITKVKDFAVNLNENATELMNLPMESDEGSADAKNKLLALLKASRKEYRSLINEIKGFDIVDKNDINENSKKNLIAKLAVDSSDYSSTDSDSDGGQIINLKRKIPKNGPHTPAIVSSTKEDSDASETVVAKEARNSRSQSSGSEAEKEDIGKTIEKLLDFNTLNCPKPVSSRNASKQKNLKKKKTKRSSDIEYFLSSSDDDDSLANSSSSSDCDRETSDEEKQMLLRRDADIRDGLLACSDDDDDDSSSDCSILSGISSDDKNLKPKSKKKDEVEEEIKAKADSKIPQANEEAEEAATASPKPTASPQTTTQLSPPGDTKVDNDEAKSVTIASSDDENDERGQPSKKKTKRDSYDREIFSKGFFEMNGSTRKEKTATNTSPSKTQRPIKAESNGEKVADGEKDTDGAIDVSMYDCRPSAKNVDLQKYIERRAHANDVAGPSSAAAQHNMIKPVPIMNEDEWISLSSDSDSEISAAPAGSAARIPKRKKMLTEEELQEETKRANKEENNRVERLKKKNETLTQMLTMRNTQRLSEPLSQGDEPDQELILDYDMKTKATISVHPQLVKKLKEHQKEGIKFMYDTCYGSIADDVKTKSGCILAHCMGLGKTLQLITLLHTLISYPEKLETRKVIVICPKSTILNWFEEFKKWLSGIDAKGLKVWHLGEQKFADRIDIINHWFESQRPGVFLINYEAFRYMVHYSGSKRSKIQLPEHEVKRLQEVISKCLLDPGPDLVVCDEGHLIKNQTGATNKAITKIATHRRIILTGTPVQNNLNEYYAMVDWIKPALLGTVKEFNNLYANPIKDGQHIDSTPGMIKKMKQRSFILNRSLSKFVQRKEASVLKEFLPDKHEYCIFVPLTKVQERVYERFLKQNPLDGGHKLLHDYTALRKIWTHPKVLQNAYERAMKGELRIGEAKKGSKNQVDEGENEDEDLLDTFDGNTGVKSNWWKEFANEDDLESLLSSNKLILLFEILRMCEQLGEKVLIFSAFVAVLNVVEDFMKKINNQDTSLEAHQRAEKYGYSDFRASWQEGLDYFRLDGSTKQDARHQMIQKFNDRDNKRMRCFLISARAGGQGINLIGANRCIILDTAWNPSADQQNIFRIYRLGQPKACFVYRLIALGTMEEKVYSRSVTKQAMSGRVVDKLQIDRHYRMDELSELYVLTKTDYSKRPPPRIPVDHVLKHLLHKLPNQAFKYHDHESLLENKPEQDLNDEEINEAWQLYKQESSRSNLSRTSVPPNGMIPNYPADLLRADMAGFNYLAAASNLSTNPLDQASGIFNHLYGSPTYFPNLQSMIPFDISTALRNTLVPTSSIASTTVASTSSAASSLLRTQLNNKAPDFGLPPIFNFVNPPASASRQSSQASQARKRRPSNAKKPSTSSNIDNMISLQQRYNGNIARPPDNFSDILSTKNNSANMIIIPDGSSANSRRQSPHPSVARQSPSLNKSNPTSVNIANDKSKPPANAASPLASPQNLSRKAPPATMQKVAYSPDLIRVAPLATASQFAKSGLQVNSQIQKDLQTLKSRQQTSPAYSTNRGSVNVPPRTSTTNPSPSQSARTTPVKSVNLTSEIVAPLNRTLTQKKSASNFVNLSSGVSPKISKTTHAQGSSSGNPIAQQMPTAKTPGPKAIPPTRVITANQGISASLLASRRDAAPKIIKQNVPQNRSNSSIQVTPPRTVMSTASQNSIPQKDAVRLVGKFAPAKQPVVPKRVVVRSSPNASQPTARDAPKYHHIHPTTQSPISITKLTSPGGSDQRGRPTPVISSAVSLHKIAPTSSKVSSQASTSSSGSLPILSQKRTIETPPTQSPKRQRIGSSQIRIISRDEKERMNQDTPSVIEDIVEIE